VLAQSQPFKMKLNMEILDPLQKIGKNSLPETPEPAAFSDPKKAKKEIEDEDTLRYIEILKGTPMEVMAVEIGKRDKKVAAFLIGIGRKESSWGEHSPKKNGQECYNYWGYRGKENTTASGYSCFDSPQHAIAVVGGKIEKLIDQRIDTPERMIVWKCGRTCAGHDPGSVKKWISDVSHYFYRLNS
jgi:hypothetical protein